jgi:hypothetical protein
MEKMRRTVFRHPRMSLASRSEIVEFGPSTLE